MLCRSRRTSTCVSNTLRLWDMSKQRRCGSTKATNPGQGDITVVEDFAALRPGFVRIKTALESGRNITPALLIRSAETVRKELVIRLAHTIKALISLPFVVGINPSITDVYQVYWNTFNRLRVVEPVTTEQQEKEFTVLLQTLFAANTDTVAKLSSGIKAVRQHKMDHSWIDDFVTKFMYQRLSRRIMASHHMAFHQQQPGYIGIFNTEMNIHNVVKRVLSIVAEMCSTHYAVVPDVEIVGDLDATVSYVPGHLEYMLMELLKNAMRAVVEEHSHKGDMPAIVIRLCQGKKKNVTVAISDRGGGVPDDIKDEIWQFGFTSVNRDDLRESKVQVPDFFEGLTAPDHRGPSHFAGYGFGLPTCKVYAAYLGGELSMVNIDGYGAEVYLHLRSVDSDENLANLLL